MGNCMGMQKPVVTCVDDDDFWGEACGARPEKKESEGRATAGPAPAAAGGSAREIKIKMKVKMSKQQLEELLRRANEGKELPLQQVLAGLASIQCDGREEERRWRPNLQSIPEIPE